MNPRPGQKFLEIGAGNSRYLPGFAQEFGIQAFGLDYSPDGVSSAIANLDAAAVSGEVRQRDLFDPPPDWEGAFDVVFSMGVIEHFDDGERVVTAMRKYAVPGGKVVTVAPNMHGFPGWATRWLSEDLFHIHRPFTPKSLATVHSHAGLQVISARYLIAFDAWVSNPSASPNLIKRSLYWPWLALSRAIWLADERLSLPTSRFASPWVIVTARVGPHG